jgi:heat shock protein HtpX
MGAFGLKTHIWNNNLKSVLLLVGFPILLLALTYALLLLWQAGANEGGLGSSFAAAAAAMPAASVFAFAVAGGWFAVAFVGHQAMIDLAVGARKVERADEPELYNLLENLCISRGLAVPRLRIIPVPAMNAFASGLTERTNTITVTRGLLDALNEDELEAVLAHELTHIRNRDVRLLVIAAVFVGIISFVGEMLFRGMTRTNMPRTSRNRRSGGGNAGALVLIALAIIGIAYALAIVIRFALSRRREYLADAGSVELTKNPDAMISALRKISGHAEISKAPAEIREMFLENKAEGFAGLFATHPPIEKRIEALVRYAGGRDL